MCIFQVEKRGVAHVVKHTAANIKDSAKRVAAESKRGGEQVYMLNTRSGVPLLGTHCSCRKVDNDQEGVLADF